MTLNSRSGLDLEGHDSDLDEPMASQSADVEAPLTHNSSKNNFFAPEDNNTATAANAQQTQGRGSFKVSRKI